MDSTLEGVESAELGTKSKQHTVPRLAKRPAKMIVCRARCKVSGFRLVSFGLHTG